MMKWKLSNLSFLLPSYINFLARAQVQEIVEKQGITQINSRILIRLHSRIDLLEFFRLLGTVRVLRASVEM